MPKNRQRPHAKRTPCNSPPAAPPPTTLKVATTRRTFRAYAALCLRGFVPLTLLLGAWIYSPRPAGVLSPGMGVIGDCPSEPNADLSVQILDGTTYKVYLSIGQTDQCKSIQLITPPNSHHFVLARELEEMPSAENMARALRDARTPLPVHETAINLLGQQILTINLEAIGHTPFTIEMLVDGITAIAFEKYRLLLPKRIAVDGDPAGGREIPLMLSSAVVPSGFDALEVSPSPSALRRQIGPEMIYFGNPKLDELNIVLLSRSRDMWKNVYTAAALAVAASVIAAWISSFTQRA